MLVGHYKQVAVVHTGCTADLGVGVAAVEADIGLFWGIQESQKPSHQPWRLWKELFQPTFQQQQC